MLTLVYLNERPAAHSPGSKRHQASRINVDKGPLSYHVGEDEGDEESLHDFHCYTSENPDSGLIRKSKKPHLVEFRTKILAVLKRHMSEQPQEKQQQSPLLCVMEPPVN